MRSYNEIEAKENLRRVEMLTFASSVMIEACLFLGYKLGVFINECNLEERS